MDLKNIQSLFQNQRENKDSVLPDSSETIYISPLALIKMLKHSRAGIPMEVMGLMLGEFVDDYTVVVQDVFAMPQSGTTVSVESVDPVFQTNMLEMLKQTNRTEMVIGWYHSHPGFGCWLSSVDTNTQQSFESLNKRAVAIVVDPIQSVRGKVVIDAFRLISGYPMMPRSQIREHTSNEGFLKKPTIQALIHGLNKGYYSINIKYRVPKSKQNLMLGLYKDRSKSLEMEKHKKQLDNNEKTLKELLDLTKKMNAQLDERKSKENFDIRKVGLVDAKAHLQTLASEIIESNVSQTISSIYGLKIF